MPKEVVAKKHPLHRIKVDRKAIGQHKADGLAYFDENRIVVDPHQTAFSEMDTYIHEFLHLADKRMKEEKVKRVATILAQNLWRNGYRKVVLK